MSRLGPAASARVTALLGRFRTAAWLAASLAALLAAPATRRRSQVSCTTLVR